MFKPADRPWLIWIVILLFVLFLLWLYFGGGEYEFVGATPLIPPELPEVSSTTLQEETATIPDEEIKITPVKWKNQEECCRVLEEIFQQPFHRDIRPDFLRNPETGAKLELDCYNANLKVALEYNGEQHYKFPNRFHRTYQEWQNQVRRDEYKRTICDRNNIYLIIIPYTVPFDQIRETIHQKLRPFFEQLEADTTSQN